MVFLFLELDLKKGCPTMWNVRVINWVFFFFLMFFFCYAKKKMLAWGKSGGKEEKRKGWKFYSATVVKSNNSVWWRELLCVLCHLSNFHFTRIQSWSHTCKIWSAIYFSSLMCVFNLIINLIYLDSFDVSEGDIAIGF